MTHDEFEHVVSAAAHITNDEIVVIGSQAIHGQFASPPASLLVSREVDVYPRYAPERAIEIDGALGDGSQFDRTYGYYAHGVGPETPIGPAGWQDRLVRIELTPRGARPSAVAWCLEMHDLFPSKLAAGRPHDLGVRDHKHSATASPNQPELSRRVELFQPSTRARRRRPAQCGKAPLTGQP